MRKIAEEFASQGENIDFLMCSSDPDSLDGIILKERSIALIDATSPHTVDPINPGAVDTIIHLGEYWNEEGIRQNKNAVMATGRRIHKYFAQGYNYLAAAGNIYENIANIYEEAAEKAEIYKMAARIVNKELGSYEISLSTGGIKKAFASAVTPEGIVNQIHSLVKGYKRIYLISGPVGFSSGKILSTVMESAAYRGFFTEAYYCPIRPAGEPEHLLIPELSVALLSANAYHDVEAWEIAESASDNGDYPEIILIDMNEMSDESEIELQATFIEKSLAEFENLLSSAIKCIRKAKKEHDLLESYYIPNMDFKKIDILRNEIIGKIREQGL
ncbi:MAG: hypothetical protein PHW03_02450 [Eubacteriales bacterium]|nr:hypothetical protein [Eubacteriales bacterium]